MESVAFYCSRKSSAFYRSGNVDKTNALKIFHAQKLPRLYFFAVFYDELFDVANRLRFVFQRMTYFGIRLTAFIFAGFNHFSALGFRVFHRYGFAVFTNRRSAFFNGVKTDLRRGVSVVFNRFYLENDVFVNLHDRHRRNHARISV